MEVGVLRLRRGEGALNRRIGVEDPRLYGGGRRVLRVRGYRLKCGFLSFRGPEAPRQAEGLLPPPTWRRAGGASGLAPTWPRHGGWGGGVPCPLARRVPRAGQRPRPRPGEGRPGGGAERRLGPSLRGPLPSSPGIVTSTSGWNLRGDLRAVMRLLGGTVCLDPQQTPSWDQGICLGIRPGFVHSCVGTGGRRRIGSLWDPSYPPVSCLWILPLFGSWGDGACPCDLPLVDGGASS